MAEGEEFNELGSEPISSLLCISRSAHKSWDFADNAEVYLEARVHKPVIKYDEMCAPYLKNLGLYQFSMIEHANTDPRLIMALVERWRPETHTFHLLVGETTVTLEDVSCLWGLPISGDIVIGDSDTDLYDLIERCLGSGKADEVIYRKTLRGATIQVEFCIMLHLLRVNTQELLVMATEEEVARYTRAYIMDLFGSVLFPDCTGDSVPVMYLRFLSTIQLTSSLSAVKMSSFDIDVFRGGEITYSPEIDVQFSKMWEMHIDGNELTIITKVKRLIQNRLYLDAKLRGLPIEIQCRVNIGKGDHNYFNLMIVGDENSWKYTVQMALKKMERVKLVVKTIARVIDSDDDDLIPVKGLCPPTASYQVPPIFRASVSASSSRTRKGRK